MKTMLTGTFSLYKILIRTDASVYFGLDFVHNENFKKLFIIPVFLSIFYFTTNFLPWPENILHSTVKAC